MKLFVRLSIGLVVAAAVVSANETRSAEYVSHRAEYKYFLGRSETRAGGSLEENRITCDAWVQTTRHRMHGPRLIPTIQRLDITEYRDGRGMIFLHHLSAGGERLIRLEGSVARARNGGRLIARFTSPKAKEVPLPRGTIFATAFYFRTLRELTAAPRKTVGRAPVFGLLSRGAALHYVEARRAKESAPLFIKVAGDADLLDAPAIDVEMRLFDARRAKTPRHRIVMKLHANGIYSRAIYYLPRVTISAEVARIEKLDTPRC